MKLIFLLIPGLLPLLLVLGCGDTCHGEQNEPTEGIVAGYFQGEEALTGGELWRTDGTPQNTYLVFIRKLRMDTAQFSYGKRALFRCGKEIKG